MKHTQKKSRKSLKRNTRKRIHRIKGGNPPIRLTQQIATQILQKRHAIEFDCNNSKPGIFGCKSGCKSKKLFMRINNENGIFKRVPVQNGPVSICSATDNALQTGDTPYIVATRGLATSGELSYPEDKVMKESELTETHLENFIKQGFI